MTIQKRGFNRALFAGLLGIFLLTSASFGWYKTFGSPGRHDRSSTIIKLTDSTFLFCGSIATSNGLYPYLINLDENGDTIWTKTVSICSGDTQLTGSSEYIGNILQDGDNLLVAGTIANCLNVADYGYAPFIAQFDLQGNLIKYSTFPDTIPVPNYGLNILKTDSNYVLITNYIRYLVNSDFDIIDEQSAYISAKSGIKTTRGDILLFGSRLLMLDSSLTYLWDTDITSPDFNLGIINSAIQTDDSTFLITGYTRTAGFESRFYIGIINDSGKVLSDTIYTDLEGEGMTVFQLNDTCYGAAGKLLESGGDGFDLQFYTFTLHLNLIGSDAIDFSTEDWVTSIASNGESKYIGTGVITGTNFDDEILIFNEDILNSPINDELPQLIGRSYRSDSDRIVSSLECFDILNESKGTLIDISGQVCLTKPAPGIYFLLSADNYFYSRLLVY